VSDGIHRIPIPTPFAVGRVNVYLIEDDPLTLVDTGPNSASWMSSSAWPRASSPVVSSSNEVLVLPGHGEPIRDHRALIDERFAFHRRRAEKIHRLIAERPRTAYEIAQELWGNIAVTQAYLTLSEVLGHVDLLLNAGRVREVDRAGTALFEAA
jgi:glyoxylase-like metal-dependent hydrolase (beta-lactamase superfamily II)